MTRATALTQSALANARRNIGYPYPSPSSRSVEALGTSAAECAANATASLRRALGQLEAAGPGRGVVFLRRALSEITTALAELSALAP
jgi:hypothetical protein